MFRRVVITGVGIVGHVETPTLTEGQSTAEVEAHLGELTLPEVKRLLDEAVARRTDDPAPSP